MSHARLESLSEALIEIKHYNTNVSRHSERQRPSKLAITTGWHVAPAYDCDLGVRYQ